jgi:hypothetical protein
MSPDTSNSTNTVYEANTTQTNNASNWVGSTWSRGQNPVSETSGFNLKGRMMDNAQNCDRQIN